MKYIFRGHVLFEYFPNQQYDKVEMGWIDKKHAITTWEHCRMIDEDYKLLSMFFDKIYRHTQGDDVDLTDIVV
jgi:hypothetical protein